MQRMYKKYIEVEMLVDKMGDITPLALIWDGERYEVDKIIRHKPQAHSQKLLRRWSNVCGADWWRDKDYIL